VVLVHAAAGGVGLLLSQWAKSLGARVIGTVSSEDKAVLARGNGCDQVIVTRDYRFAAQMNHKADVIYDGLGQAAARENFEALALRGHWVSYGQASGPHETFPDLTAKSGTLSRPVLFHYTADHLQEMAGNVFRALKEGVMRTHVRHRYPLGAAADAHRDLEARRTTGSLLLLP
jgi:NADPH:quinone reductase-like Zn-dependent oxidoreductase